MKTTKVSLLKPVSYIVIMLSLIGASLAKAATPANTIDELLNRVIEAQKNSARVNDERIAIFRTKRNQQKQLLGAAQQVIRELEEQANRYKLEIESLKQQGNELDDEITEKLSNYTELFGVTRQVAAETRSAVNQSMVSAEHKDRINLLDEIAKGDRLPTLQQLQALWLLLLQEQTEQGKVKRFNTSIAGVEGKSVVTEVVRFGNFTAISDGQYLSFNPESQRLEVLQRQPGNIHLKNAKNYLKSDSNGDGLVQATIDPSGGTILGMLVQAPNLMERFHQGGVVGYIVTAMALIGVSIGLLRLLLLSVTARKVTRQMKNKKITKDNPLGRVLAVYARNPKADTDTLELKLGDAILQELPKLDRGLGLLKVLAAVAPLMGLLGTVVGMIITFQAITLWGAGDPKLMASGISQALMTTVQGLVAAIPLLLLHSIASGKVKDLQHILQEQSAGLIAKRSEVMHV